jgi:hypothetical protein
VSDIDTAAADSLKALDLEWPIREADILRALRDRAKPTEPEAKALGYFYFEDEPTALGGEATEQGRGTAHRGQHRKVAGVAAAVKLLS